MCEYKKSRILNDPRGKTKMNIKIEDVCVVFVFFKKMFNLFRFSSMIIKSKLVALNMFLYCMNTENELTDHSA